MVKNKSRKKPKSSGFPVSATIPEDQYKAIVKLEGILGVGLKGVVANIIHSWLYEQDWFKERVRDKLKK